MVVFPMKRWASSLKSLHHLVLWALFVLHHCCLFLCLAVGFSFFFIEGPRSRVSMVSAPMSTWRYAWSGRILFSAQSRRRSFRGRSFMAARLLCCFFFSSVLRRASFSFPCILFRFFCAVVMLCCLFSPLRWSACFFIVLVICCFCSGSLFPLRCYCLEE